MSNLIIYIGKLISNTFKKGNMPSVFNPPPAFEKENFKHNFRMGLESLYIINSTNNYDILLSRIEVFESAKKDTDDFISKNKSTAMSLITDVVDRYKHDYYDKPINDFQLNLLLGHDGKLRIQFYLECYYNSFIRHLHKQREHISCLKQDKAIINRLKFVIQNGYSYIELIGVFNNSNKDQYISNIKTIIEELQKEVNGMEIKKLNK